MTGRTHPGPPLAAPAITFTAFLLAGVAAGPIGGDGAIPSPYSHAATITHYFAVSHGATATTALFTLLSASALLFFSGLCYARLTFLAPNVPGPVVAGFGGVAASGLLALSGCLDWVLSRRSVTSDGRLTRALHAATFVAGGPAHTAALGIMVAGLSVTTLFLRRTPRRLGLVGVGLAAVDVLSLLTLVAPGAAPLIPIGRFLSMAWLIAISLLLPRSREARGPARRYQAAEPAVAPVD